MRDYRKIEAWKLADDLTVLVYEATRNYPKEELYGITSQLPEDGRQRTEDRGRRTEDRGRRTDVSESILSFRDLRVYQAAFQLQQMVFDVTKTFPREERYALTDQFRRAARSIGANIAESWQKRRYIAHFVSKLTDSDGEQAETQHWIETSFACNYISQEIRDDLMTKCLDIGKKLGRMLAAPEKFCHSTD